MIGPPSNVDPRILGSITQSTDASKAAATSDAIQAGSALIESILIFVKFIMTYQNTRAAGSTVHERISHMKAFNPLLYVFYRDGTLFFIPMLVLSILDITTWFVDLTQTIVGFVLINTNVWYIWLYVFYWLITTRLILNIRMADCDFNESLVSKPIHSIQFHRTTHHDSDGIYASGELEEIREEHCDQCQSPAPSQARSMRQSITKTTSGENVRVSITVDTIKQQLNDGLQILAEFKKSLRPSSDVQRYDEAVGSLEGAAKGLTTLKNKLSNRKVGGSTNSRNSYVLPPPDLKVDFEDTPFSMTIPGIEESGKETTLGVVPENGEVQEEVKGRIEL
ncbi:hypothetical protein NP233_g10813 [Leucocoprinus birnbaumii]|uniref:Uncharacterized protein n=1 Tax=Leucocoprinus birnbaumii TaxID=56174 RepID=A0AAD5YRI7_9AGAR|nr:hypothetical protein NP233_g10813 [Leucocoprinus birnbaumii]